VKEAVDLRADKETDVPAERKGCTTDSRPNKYRRRKKGEREEDNREAKETVEDKSSKIRVERNMRRRKTLSLE
jgi:hypothetical protein